MRISDWRSDVCSSDLIVSGTGDARRFRDDAQSQSAEPRLLDGFGPQDRSPLRLRSDQGRFAQDRQRPARLQCVRSEEHTSELQSLMRISYAVFCLKKKKNIYKSILITFQISTTTYNKELTSKQNT